MTKKFIVKLENRETGTLETRGFQKREDLFLFTFCMVSVYNTSKGADRMWLIK